MIDGHTFTHIALDILHPNSTMRRQGFLCSHGSFVARLIELAQLSSSNLVIAWYYLYKYTGNSILAMESEPEEDTMTIHLILTALILSNKLYDDQSFTLKTWLSLINSSSPPQKFTPSLKTLDTMERHFLAALDYRVSYRALESDVHFWRVVPSYVACFDQYIPEKAPVLELAPGQTLLQNPSYYTPPSCCPSSTELVPLTPVTPLFAFYPGAHGTPLTPLERAPYQNAKLSGAVLGRARLHMPRVTKPAHRAHLSKGYNSLSALVAGWTEAHMLGGSRI